MREKYVIKLLRKADFGSGGNVVMSFHVGIAEEVLGFIPIIWEKEEREKGKKYKPHINPVYDWIDKILFKYPSLTKDEAIRVFGFIEFPDYVEVQPVTGELVIPSDREKIKEVTGIVREWFMKGIRKCLEFEKQKGLEEWLWKNSIAIEPSFEFQPVELITDENE